MAEIKKELAGDEKLAKRISDLKLEEANAVLSFIMEMYFDKKFRLDIFPHKTQISFHASALDKWTKTSEINKDELKNISTTLSLMLTEYIKDGEEHLLKIIEEYSPESLDKTNELLGNLKRYVDVIKILRERYLLYYYSKIPYFDDIEWDVHTKYYHSDNEEREPFSVSNIRILLNTPYSIEENFPGYKKDIVFEITLSDIIKLKKSINDIENKLKSICEDIEG